MTEQQPQQQKIEHKPIRVVLKTHVGPIPPDVKREHKTVDWAEALYSNAMRMAAAGVLVGEGSLDKAASLLGWAGFAVPYGYFPEDSEGDLYDPRDEEALQLWVEAEAGRIERISRSKGFYLAATGQLLDELDPPSFEED